MGFFDRFRKQEAASLEELQAKGYWVDLVRAYFAKGKECLARGDRERADLWLSRAQAICDSDDGIYEKVGGKLIDQCSDLLGELEDDLFGTQVVERVEAEYSTLSGARKRLWGLLTLCRLERLLTAVGDFPGCAPLKDTGEAIDALLDFIAGWCDSPAILDERAALPAPAGAFRLPDLGGEIVPTELSLYLDVVVSGDLSREEIRGLDDPQVLDRLDLNDQSGMIRCGLLTHYWLRVQDGPLEAVPQVRAEVARIWDDLAFLRTGPDEKALRARAAEYRKLDILA